MWYEVAIFHAKQHTLLIQSLQQLIHCVFTSFSCGSSSLVWAAPFPVDHTLLVHLWCVVHRKKGPGMRD